MLTSAHSRSLTGGDLIENHERPFNCKSIEGTIPNQFRRIANQQPDHAAIKYGRVTLFRAQRQTITKVLFGTQDMTHGWGKLALGGVDVQEVSGAHHNIHLSPNVETLAAALTDCLERSK